VIFNLLSYRKRTQWSTIYYSW